MTTPIKNFVTLVLKSIGLLCLCGAALADGKPQATSTGDEGGGGSAAPTLEDRLGDLRSVPREKRAETIKKLAAELRAIPPSTRKLELSVALSWVCTEGDFGLDTLQSVAETLEQVIAQEPALMSTNGLAPIPALARLAHFEGVKTTLKKTEFLAEMKRLEELDRKLEEADFTLKDLAGKAWHLRGLRGKVVLVNFWATWCPPCREELPDLNALAERHPTDLVVLGISSESAEELRSFVARQPIKYPILVDAETNVNLAFGIEGIPRTIIYDRNGKMAAQACDMRSRKQLEAMVVRAQLSGTTP